MTAPDTSTTTKTIRWGILSTGTIARSFCLALMHAGSQQQQPPQCIAAVGSRSLTSAQKFIEQIFPDAQPSPSSPSQHSASASILIPTAHGSYESLVRDPQVDIVYIASPHALHYEHAIMCLQAGKHVLCEKSFCVNAQQADAMISLARERGLFLMEAMWTRCLPAVRHMRSLLLEGAIGDIVAMQGNMAFFGDINDTNHRLFNMDLAGGALLDVGVYLLSMASLVMGGRPPTTVHSAMSLLHTTGVDEQCAMILTWGDSSLQEQQDPIAATNTTTAAAATSSATSTIATLHCSIKSKLPRTFTITGTRGYLQLSDPFNRASQLVVCQVSDEAICSSGGTGNARRQETVETIKFEEMQGLEHVGLGLHFQALHVAECLMAGKTESDLMPLDETALIMRTMDIIRQQNGFKYPPHVETTGIESRPLLQQP